MADYTDLGAGIRVATQLPTVAKAYFLTEASMIDLGIDNNLAYSYEEGVLVYCAAEDSYFRWREVKDDAVGVIANNFVYPSNHYVGGINYSNRVFNFFPAVFIPAATPYLALRIKDKGEGNENEYKLQVGDIVQGRKTKFTYWDSAIYIGNDPADRDNCYTPLVETIIDFENPDFPDPDDNQGPPGKSAYEIALENGFVGTEEEWLESLNGQDGADGVDGISAYQVAVNNGFVGTESQWLISLKGTNGTNGADGDSAYQIALDNGFVGTEADWLLSLKGTNGAKGNTGATGPAGPTGPTGPAGQDYTSNLQKTITHPADFPGDIYTVSNADNNYSIFIENGANPVSIVFPAGLMAKIQVGFIQKGTGLVTAVESGTTLEFLTGLGLKMDGIEANAYAEQYGSSNVIQWMGNIKA